MKSEQEDMHLNKIMHEVYSTIGSIKQVLDRALLNVGRGYDFDKRKVQEDITEASMLMDNLDMYLQYWQSVGEGIDYYSVTRTNPEFPIYSFFSRPNNYFQRRMKKYHQRYEFDSNMPQWKFPVIEAFPTLSAIPNILFDNAIKYTIPEESIKCNLIAGKDDVTIEFSNYGPYLTESECKSIYELGKRGEYANALGKQGSGYGMNFLKSIVDAHHGSVKVESNYETKEKGIPYGTFKCEIKLPIILPFINKDEDENTVEYFDSDKDD